VPETATIRNAVEQMRDKNLGCAIVINDRHEPVGMLTESELTKLLSKDSSVLDAPVLDHLQSNWPTVTLSDPISYVVDALESANIRFLIVTNEHRQLAGLTGQKGLMEYVVDHFPKQVLVHRIGCKPYFVEREGA
jgi:predicted transcriptional regulator